MKKYLHLLAILAVLGIGAILGGSAFSAGADYTAPLHSPPTCNPGEAGCDAPINVGGSLQVRGGPLTLTGLLGLKSLLFNATGVANIPLGSVLTATNADGTVGWAPAAGFACPSGFTALGNGHCIETGFTIPGETWYSAAQSCSVKNAHLCSASTWVAACQNGTFGAGQHNEWLDDLDNGGGGTNKARQGVTGLCTIDSNVLALTNATNYRCCI